MKRLILLLTLLGSTQAQAFECEGLSIQYIARTPIQLKGNVAIADVINGKNVIFYNYNQLISYPKPLQEHIWAHECAHLKFGHISRAYAGDTTIEDEADCSAIKMLKWGKKEVEELISIWSTLGYTSTDPRAEKARTCAIDK